MPISLPPLSYHKRHEKERGLRMKTTKIARILQEERQRLHEDLEDSTPLQRIRTEAQIAEVDDVAVLLGVWEMYGQMT